MQGQETSTNSTRRVNRVDFHLTNVKPRQKACQMKNNVATVLIVIGQMGDYYRFACWATGSSMIAAATYCSLFRKESIDHA